MAELYRQKVTRLAEALEHPETRTEASEAPRGPHRRHRPDAEPGRAAFARWRELALRREPRLRIELKGNLAAMLGADQNAKRPPEAGDLSQQESWLRGPATDAIERCGLGLRDYVHRIAALSDRAIIQETG